MTRARLRGSAALACALGIGGCALGPNYQRPELPAPASFREQSEEAASIADLPWWEVFRDSALQELVRESLANNRDLRTAAANVEQARHFAAVQRSELFPQFSYDAAGSRSHDATFGNPVPGQGTGSDYFALLDAAWEIDVWGRIRRSTEAARADAFASEAVRNGVVLSLVSGVAQAYFELRELDLELEIAQRTVVTFSETLAIFERQYRGGVSSRLDALRAEAALAQASAAVPEVERRIVAKENELSVLVGRPPAALARGETLTAQYEPPVIPAGVPSQLLERRPDLIQAEQQLVAANARVGASFAEFFPRIGLTALYGSASDDLSQMLSSGTGVWGAAVNGTGPIFTFGRVWYFWKASQAAAEAAVHAYEQAVLISLQDVSNSLVAREKLASVRREQQRAVDALRESLRVARVRYVGGLATYIEVLDAQQQLFPAENDLARTQRDELLALVSLYRALGGGWSEPGNPEPEG